MSLAENVAMIGKTTYKAGDIWVFRITQNVSKATVESYATSLKASVAAMFPDQIPPQLMILAPGIEFSILSKEVTGL